jgi:hypothetical protein
VVFTGINAGAAVKAFIRIKNYSFLPFQSSRRASLCAANALPTTATYAFAILPTAFVIINRDHF